MSGKTIWVLALVVGGLFWLLREQEQAEATIERPYAGPLLGDMNRERLVEVRWEHVERNENMAIVLRPNGWHITDPIDYRAAPDRVRLVLDGLFTNAQEIPKPDQAAVAKHFDPPRAVISVFAENESGVRQEKVVELGALDADGMQVEARVEGKYLRILRNIDTALLSSTSEMRRKQVFDVSFDRVASITRRGSAPSLNGAEPLDFMARREGPHWVQYEPMRVQLDPTAMAMQARVLTAFRVDGFASDLPNPDLATFGLVRPDLTLTLEVGDGTEQTLLLSEASGGGWYGKRADQPTVFAVGGPMMAQVLDPWADLRDTTLLRAFRQDIAEVEWHIEGASLRLRQGQAQRAGGSPQWTVSHRPSGAEDFGSEWPASLDKAQGLLGALEQNPIALWMDRSPGWKGDPFPADSVAPRLNVRFRYALEGETASARFGMPLTSDQGTTLLGYQREGDQAIGLVSLDLQPWISARLEDWRSPLVWSPVETRLRRLRISQGDRSQEYLRKPQGSWRFADADVRPSALLPALDKLIYLKAKRHLPAGEAAPMQDTVRVEFATVDGTWLIAELGLVGEEVQIQSNGHRAVAKDADLHGTLLGLLER